MIFLLLLFRCYFILTTANGVSSYVLINESQWLCCECVLWLCNRAALLLFLERKNRFKNRIGFFVCIISTGFPSNKAYRNSKISKVQRSTFKPISYTSNINFLGRQEPTPIKIQTIT